ncbi:MAG: DJ-1/PfpI family protein, partial [Alphaproteobacteria bacterium]|nr:DJ-1/PfpI family protein [Alphaproteobacteria bacterium]
VCTGALILGGAGVLKGLKATTHWRAMADLESFGATPTDQRVVREGKVVTAAGVSSGIDMALTLAAEIAGEDVAKAIQLGIEYAPEPPFNAGHIGNAPEDRIEMVRSGLSRP